MQLTPSIVQPKQPLLAPTSTELLRLSTILRSAPVSASQAAPAPDTVEAPPVASPPPSAAVAEATFAQKLLGNVASSQQRYVANQQLLGAISHGLTERISQIGANAWAMLRGRTIEG